MRFRVSDENKAAAKHMHADSPEVWLTVLLNPLLDLDVRQLCIVDQRLQVAGTSILLPIPSMRVCPEHLQCCVPCLCTAASRTACINT